jgi:hypothetical protein
MYPDHGWFAALIRPENIQADLAPARFLIHVCPDIRRLPENA